MLQIQSMWLVDLQRYCNGHFPHKLKYVRHAIMALQIARDVTSGGPHGSQTFAFCIQVNGNDTVF